MLVEVVVLVGLALQVVVMEEQVEEVVLVVQHQDMLDQD
jgi:hypothetical protein